MDTLLIAVVILGSLSIGLGLGLLGQRIRTVRAKGEAVSEADRILEEAQEEKRTLLIEAKEDALKTLQEGESDIRERRSEVRRNERRVANREENVERRASNLEKRERKISDREKEIDKLATEVDELKERQIRQVEIAADLTMDEAKDLVMSQAEEDAQYEVAAKYRDIEESQRNEANDKARLIIGQAIQRLASDVVSEATVSTVSLPSDDMKGRGTRFGGLKQECGIHLPSELNGEGI